MQDTRQAPTITIRRSASRSPLSAFAIFQDAHHILGDLRNSPPPPDVRGLPFFVGGNMDSSNVITITQFHVLTNTEIA